MKVSRSTTDVGLRPDLGPGGTDAHRHARPDSGMSMRFARIAAHDSTRQGRRSRVKSWASGEGVPTWWPRSKSCSWSSVWCSARGGSAGRQCSGPGTRESNRVSAIGQKIDTPHAGPTRERKGCGDRVAAALVVRQVRDATGVDDLDATAPSHRAVHSPVMVAPDPRPPSRADSGMSALGQRHESPLSASFVPGPDGGPEAV